MILRFHYLLFFIVLILSLSTFDGASIKMPSRVFGTSLFRRKKPETFSEAVHEFLSSKVGIKPEMISFKFVKTKAYEVSKKVYQDRHVIAKNIVTQSIDSFEGFKKDIRGSFYDFFHTPGVIGKVGVVVDTIYRHRRSLGIAGGLFLIFDRYQTTYDKAVSLLHKMREKEDTKWINQLPKGGQ